MTDATEQEVVELSEAEQLAADEAAFAQGFSGNTDDEPTTPEVEKVEEAETKIEDEAPTAILAGLTEDEVKNLFAKAAKFDYLEQQQQKAFGKIGQLNETIQQLKNQPKSGGVLEIKQLKRFAENFPDEAKDLIADLNEASIEVGQPQALGIDESRTGELIQTALQETQQGFELKLLGILQPDYKEMMATSDWNLWKSTLKPEDAAVLETSWDANELNGKFNAFKEWKGRTTQQQEKRKDRIAKSVQPQGAAQQRQQVLDDEAAFLAGFNSA